MSFSICVPAPSRLESKRQSRGALVDIRRLLGWAVDFGKAVLVYTLLSPAALLPMTGMGMAFGACPQDAAIDGQQQAEDALTDAELELVEAV